MDYSRPVVLSIAGFDPSGGAGVLADIKTLEQCHCLGFGALSARTVQTEDQFIKVDWFGAATVQEQVQPLLDQYDISVIKIGIVQSPALLLTLLQWLRQQAPGIRIVWDPVLAASAGHVLTTGIDMGLLGDILALVTLVTPNVAEARSLAGCAAEEQAAISLAKHCSVLLKGGHSERHPGVDLLYEKGRETAGCLYPGKWGSPKHGSGCILSAAIAARLAWGDTLDQACREAKVYIEKILCSNTQLLAYHHVS